MGCKRGKQRKCISFYFASELDSKKFVHKPENIEFRHYTFNNGLSNGYIIM
jgi:hypothetical protein